MAESTGAVVPSGVYLYCLTVDNVSMLRKLALVKKKTDELGCNHLAKAIFFVTI